MLVITVSEGLMRFEIARRPMAFALDTLGIDAVRAALPGLFPVSQRSRPLGTANGEPGRSTPSRGDSVMRCRNRGTPNVVPDEGAKPAASPVAWRDPRSEFSEP
jgi:hypothetical protein